MILRELKENDILTGSETALSQYIIDNPEKVINMTSRELAAQVYVSAPTVIRLCKKMGFGSFYEFKIKLSAEIADEYQKMLNVDYNFPFSKESTIENAVSQLATIAISNVMKLRDTFDYKTLEKICILLRNMHYIDIYGVGLSIKCASEFREKMMHIGYHVTLVDECAQTIYWADNSREGQCAIVISYSGKTKTMIQTIKILKNRGVKTILITGNKMSEMTEYADIIFYIQSEEELEMKKKIDSFGMLYNVHYLLDCIYIGVYLKNYDACYQKSQHIKSLKKYEE